MIILGINGSFDDHCLDNKWDWVHGSGASLIIDGVWKGSVSQERISRVKYDGRFPNKSIQNLLLHNSVDVNDVDIVAYATNLKDYVFFLENKVKIKSTLKKVFQNSEILIKNHHDCHAAAAFFTSPYQEANILTLDGSGDIEEVGNDLIQNHGTFGYGCKNPLSYSRITSLHYDDSNGATSSLGKFYTMFSSYILKILKAEDLNVFNLSKKPSFAESSPGKIMGLSAYGKHIDLDKNIFRIVQNSPYQMPFLQLRYDIYRSSFVNEIYKYKPEDLALWVQTVFENTILTYLDNIPKSFKKDFLCFGGGSALNILLNSKIISHGLFKDVHIPTAPNDDGNSLGAAFLASYDHGISVKIPSNIGCVGFDYSITSNNILKKEDQKIISSMNLKYEVVNNEEYLFEQVSNFLVNNKIVAWYQGRSEFGPRALCNRSILANPSFNNKELLNKKVKFREEWRPYAAVILEEFFEEWFDCPKKQSYYMLFSSFVREEKQKLIPGVVHVDKTCRAQAINKEMNLKAYNLLKTFYDKTGIPILLNTSFNTIPGEPIVETPLDALKSFQYSNIDALVIDNVIITK